jgi:hypothetical protein
MPSRPSLAPTLGLALVTLLACSSTDPVPLTPDAGGADAAAAADAGGGGGGPGPDAGAGVGDSGAGGVDAGGPADTGGVVDECDPVRQTGCAAPETQCIVENQAGRGTQCIAPPIDALARGEACMGGDCEAGLTCVNAGGAGPTCQTICDRGDGTGCAMLGGDFDCRLQLRGTNWGICAELPPTCDAVTLQPCTATQTCAPLRRTDGVFELRCVAAGDRTHGQGCDQASTRCAREHICVNVQSLGATQCRRTCVDDMDCQMTVGMGSSCAGAVSGLDVKYCDP